MEQYYEKTHERLRKIRQKRADARLIMRAEEVDLVRQEKRNNRGALLASPFIGSAVASIQLHMSEIAPGGQGSGHRHLNEAIIYILEGRGYSIIDDKKIEWKTGDTICIPPNSWHQHFNASETETATYLGFTNGPLMEHLQLREMVDEKE